MYKNFEYLCKKNNVSVYKISKDTGIARATFSDWKSGRYTPKQDKLQKIADYFHVTMEYLMTGEDPAAADFPLSPEERDLVAAYRLADEVTQNNICKLLDIKKVSGLYPEEKKW